MQCKVIIKQLVFRRSWICLFWHLFFQFIYELLLQYSQKICTRKKCRKTFLSGKNTQAAVKVKMTCFCGLPARTPETQEVESPTVVKTPPEFMNLTANRKKAQEVAASQTMKICLNPLLVVEMLSACSQFIERVRLFPVLTYKPFPC